MKYEIRKAKEGYITVTRWDHYGEHAVPIGVPKDGEREFILLDCQHSETRVRLRREDIS